MAQVNVEILCAGDQLHYPKSGNTVSIHYTAFLSGSLTKFDCSRQRRKPFKFKIHAEQVIAGLDESVAQLSIGERARINIPSSKAYGKRGFPGLIPKNSDLIFDVELITFS
mmetsp:Transcript_39977/g.47990  ORF Transcript_39977/g.47990 Transcript_39977/m.47990 type:complete len:111 (-) Transcript_39977:333-665(-)